MKNRRTRNQNSEHDRPSLVEAETNMLYVVRICRKMGYQDLPQMISIITTPVVLHTVPLQNLFFFCSSHEHFAQNNIWTLQILKADLWESVFITLKGIPFRTYWSQQAAHVQNPVCACVTRIFCHNKAHFKRTENFPAIKLMSIHDKFAFNVNGYTWQMYRQYWQGRQFFWLPYCFLAYQSPSEKMSILKNKSTAQKGIIFFPFRVDRFSEGGNTNNWFVSPVNVSIAP